MTPKQRRIKELKKLIENIEDFLIDADSAYLDLQEAKAELLKLKK